MLYTNILNDNIEINPNQRFGIAVAEFNKHFTEEMLDQALQAFESKSIVVHDIEWVPGAYELPFASKKMIERGCDAILTLGVVIRGATSHYDHVCDAVTQGVLRVSLDTGKPVIFGVITAENEQQVIERIPRSRDLVMATLRMAQF